MSFPYFDQSEAGSGGFHLAKLFLSDLFSFIFDLDSFITDKLARYLGSFCHYDVIGEQSVKSNIIQ